MEVLKKFTFNSSGSSLTQRQSLFDELFAIFKDDTARAGKQKQQQQKRAV